MSQANSHFDQMRTVLTDLERGYVEDCPIVLNENTRYYGQLPVYYNSRGNVSIADDVPYDGAYVQAMSLYAKSLKKDERSATLLRGVASPVKDHMSRVIRSAKKAAARKIADDDIL